MGNYTLPYLITARDVQVDEGLTKEHAKILKFQAFDDPD